MMDDAEELFAACQFEQAAQLAKALIEEEEGTMIDEVRCGANSLMIMW